jgi:hypothetical protein
MIPTSQGSLREPSGGTSTSSDKSAEGKLMASDDKKVKADPAQKSDASVKSSCFYLLLDEKRIVATLRTTGDTG